MTITRAPSHLSTGRRISDRARHGVERVLAGVVWLLVVGFYIWSARHEDSAWHFGERQTDYYNLLVDGMLDGHLSLKTDVPAQLLALKDPYNPANRPPGIGLHDVSMYRGKYYLYFGPAPVVMLMLPFRLVTGFALPLPAAVLVFGCLGYTAALATWWRVRRTYFAESGLVVSALAMLVLGTVSLVPILVRRGSIWELPLSGGYCFGAMAVLCIFQSLHVRRGNMAWLAGASLLLGLAIASRPTYLYGVGLLLLPLVWHWRRRRAAAIGRSGEWAPVIAGLVPLICVGELLAVYNYARFGSPTEFGVAYQFSGIYEATAHHFRWAYLPYNLGLYAFAPVEWSRYFPFIHTARIAAGPVGHVGIEEVCGLAWHMPVLWFSTLVVLGLRARSDDERDRLKGWLAATAALGVGTLFTLGFFYAAMGRYQTDFVPTLALLSAVGLLAVDRQLRTWTRLLRWGMTVVVRGIAVASIAFGTLFSLAMYGGFQQSSPRSFVRVARLCNYPVYWWERLNRVPIGAVEITLRFPDKPAAKVDPLVRTGSNAGKDHVFVEYGANGLARLGYAHDPGRRLYSDWFATNPGITHHIRVEMGSLFPPEEHPFWVGVGSESRVRTARWLHVTMDDKVLLDSYQRFNPTDPDGVMIGSEPPASEFGQKFSGALLSVRRDPERRPSAGGPDRNSGQLFGIDDETVDLVGIEMRISMPPVRPTGTREPIVITGSTARGDFLYVEYLDADRVRFGLEHWGKPGIYSPPVPWGDARGRRVKVSLGSFPWVSAKPADRVVLRIDDEIVWDTQARFYDADATDVFVGCNPIGGTACGSSFSGRITEIKPVMRRINGW